MPGAAATAITLEPLAVSLSCMASTSMSNNHHKKGLQVPAMSCQNFVHVSHGVSQHQTISRSVLAIVCDRIT
jgi:hypothetical protein